MPPQSNPSFASTSSDSARRAQPAATRNLLATEAVTAAGRIIRQLTGNPALRQRLHQHGFGREDLRLGSALHQDASRTCETCSAVLRLLGATQSTRIRAFAAARKEYSQFRRVVKNACAASYRETACLSSPVRQSLGNFIVQATASYLAALKVIPPKLLADHGFPTQRIYDALVALQELASLARNATFQTRQASISGKSRDRAVSRLNTWIERLLEVTKQAFSCAAPPPRPITHGTIRAVPRSHQRINLTPSPKLNRRLSWRFD